MLVRKGNDGFCKRTVQPIKDRSAQMTVELCVVFPVAIILALIVVNAMTFFSYCAEFDRTARNSVRVNAAAPTHGEAPTSIVSKIEAELASSFSEDNLEVSVDSTTAGDGLATYRMTLDYSPTLFGMGLRSEVLGVPLPKLTHTSSLTVSPYRPGMLF